jgi:hypothetical protein
MHNAASLFNEAARLAQRAITTLGNLDGSRLRLAAPGGGVAHVVHPPAIVETYECCSIFCIDQAPPCIRQRQRHPGLASLHWTNACVIEAQMTNDERFLLIIGLLGPASLVPRDPRIPVEVLSASRGWAYPPLMAG